MKTIYIPDTTLAVSEFCLGAMQFGHKVTGGAIDQLFNVFRDGGGNFIDTAHCYCFWNPAGAGSSELIVGDYLKRNKVRDEFVIATKGGHPPGPKYRRNSDSFLSPYRVKADIDDSLGRLNIDSIDLYWLHRDDPRIPVGEIIEMLEAERKSGRIRYFGGSNWTSQRLAEANTYAKDHGISGFVASQPRWNLAITKEDPEGDKRLEPGTLLAFSETDAKWHKESGLPVIPYTPTAGGFFAQKAEKPEQWRTSEGIARYQRTEKLANELDASPNQIALAWLRHKPFPVIPILGTSKVKNLVDAIGAADVSLSAEQANWLKNG